MPLLTAIALYASVLYGCSTAGRKSLPAETLIKVSVVEEDTSPVSDAEVIVHGIASMKTASDGKASFRIKKSSKTKIKISVNCPPGKSITGSRDAEYMVGTGRSLDGGVPVLHHRAVCAADILRLPLVVRAGGQPGIVIRAEGETVARSDEHGVAQAVIKAGRSEEISIILDTSNNPSLRPGSPEHVIRTGKKSRIILIDQDFEVRKKRIRKKASSGPSRL